MSLQELSLKAVPHPGEQARKFLPPWHTVHIAREEREFNERIDRFRQEHKLRFWNFITRNNNIVSAIEIIIIERNRILLGLLVIYNTSHEPPRPVPVCISCFYVHSSIYQQAIVCGKEKHTNHHQMN